MIFVLGPGRSGTSSVARLLAELGVFMGDKLRSPTAENPEGYWEDLEFKDLNVAFLERRMDYDEWRERMKAIEREEPWGFKDPRLCYLLPFYLRLFPQAQLLRCRRPLADVALSMSRSYGWGIGDAMVEATRREQLLDHFAQGAYEIHFARRRDDEELKCLLSNLLK